MVHFPDFACFHDEARHVSLASFYEVAVKGRGGEEGRHCRVPPVHAPVAQNDKADAFIDISFGISADAIDRRGQEGARFVPGGAPDPGAFVEAARRGLATRLGGARYLEEHRNRGHAEIGQPRIAEPSYVGIGKERMEKLELSAGGGRLVQEVFLLAYIILEGHDEIFPVGVDRRVGYLGEELAEVRVQKETGLGEARPAACASIAEMASWR